MDILGQVADLIAAGQSALRDAEAKDYEEFLAKADEYLRRLEQWQQAMQSHPAPLTELVSGDEEKAALRGSVEELTRVHQQLIELATHAKDSVGMQMGDLHKRATGLKRYVDAYPSRVSITGKRKG